MGSEQNTLLNSLNFHFRIAERWSDFAGPMQRWNTTGLMARDYSVDERLGLLQFARLMDVRYIRLRSFAK